MIRINLPKQKRLTMRKKKKSLVLWVLRITIDSTFNKSAALIFYIKTLSTNNVETFHKKINKILLKKIQWLHIYVDRQVCWKKRCCDRRRKSKKNGNGRFLLCDIFSLSSLHICIKVIVNNVHLTSAVCGTNAY